MCPVQFTYTKYFTVCINTETIYSRYNNISLIEVTNTNTIVLLGESSCSEEFQRIRWGQAIYSFSLKNGGDVLYPSTPISTDDPDGKESATMQETWV